MQKDRQLSLWSFFKTAEFWDGDILVKPVLILDDLLDFLIAMVSERPPLPNSLSRAFSLNTKEPGSRAFPNRW